MTDAKKTYFLDLLARYIKDGVLDTRTLRKTNPKLYEEFRLAFKGIRVGCQILGIHPSAAALRAKVGPVRKQIRTLALAYIEEHGLEEAAKKLGVGPDSIKKVHENLLAPQAIRGRKKRADAGRARKK
ncbi:MAG: hypothetical protein ACM3X6_01090 [Patescibacteria group bacterium]